MDTFEKKYNEALNWMQKLYPGLHGATKEDAEHYFPELRESEDERMMREFNDWLCEEIECRTNDLRDEKDRRTLNMLCYILTKVKDWLEKQKEPTTEELYAEAGTTEKEYIANTMKMVRAMREKKQVQKPVEIDFEDWDTLGYIRDIVRKHVRRDEEFNVLDKWLTEHYVNQKPAEIHNPTDEEVESWRNELTEFKKFATKQAKENQLHISYTRDVMWENFCSELLSFVNSRKPVEWSEEDEKMVRFYEDDYNNNLSYMPMSDVIENRIKFKDWLLNRLKSLRPQPKQGKKGLILTEEQEKKFGHLFTRPSWKPSKEQMKGLKFFLDFHRLQRNAGTTNWREYDAVESLYEQLKKL